MGARLPNFDARVYTNVLVSCNIKEYTRKIKIIRENQVQNYKLRRGVKVRYILHS